MSKILKKSLDATKLIVPFLYLIITDSFIVNHKMIECISNEQWIIVIKLILITIPLMIFSIGYYFSSRRRIEIKHDNYNIVVEYGDIFEKYNCKKIIDFDECFTTVVGGRPEDVKETSVCGQYLKRYPISNDEMKKMIRNANVKPETEKSLFKSKVKYRHGKLVPRGDDYLLMSFASLNEVGRGEITYDEYVNCLNLLWKEIDIYYGQKDVCIPILGSGKVRFKDIELSQQELLDIIIGSYKLSRYKLKLPNCLHIICKEREGFDLCKIHEY